MNSEEKTFVSNGILPIPIKAQLSAGLTAGLVIGFVPALSLALSTGIGGSKELSQSSLSQAGSQYISNQPLVGGLKTSFGNTQNYLRNWVDELKQ